MKAELVSTEFDVPQQHLVLDTLPVTVGRSQDADLRLPDPWVSRIHCGIDQINDVLVVRDLGSRHGTYVNGLRISEALLMPGNRLSMGLSSFVVHYERSRTKRPQAG